AESQGFEAYPAPEWILPDPEGNIISLKDLRGQILILDFWATWCGPCRSAMPLINEWMATDMPEGVQVFSINVWEDDKQAVIKFMNDNKYAMHLLFGTEELTSLYGVEGIPFICVIDGEGMVRGVEKGYSPTLKDTLNAWVNEILGR
ncbi:MAG: TlpA family protein disulfide reductase, partial [Candidatus Cloacimonetes bacterium]|nr:TlpA family protein disulfide reductase [Candidatus Cloacimonadota bacterium]